ncbi:MAG: discoidin domain-containing protein [Bacteroidota bacterium]|nr:discoidin domain-containing protein [Bacteroidota bacterium]
MKNLISGSLSILLFTIMCLGASAQAIFTPYDYFPGLIRDYKPAFDKSYPEWGKMLYEYPVNYEEITAKYDSYIQEHGNIKDPLTRYFKLWNRAVGPYAQSDGTISLPGLSSYYKNLNEAQVNARKKANTRDESNWVFLGPKETFWLNESGSSNDPLSCPWQVNVYSFDVAASDHNILYCGTETGYVNKTNDAGMSWQLLVPEYPFGGAVTAVAIHPNDADIVYVSAGNQLHKTTDGGQSWLPLLPGGSLFYANRLKIDDANPQIIISSSSNGVHLSTDGGNTWAQKWYDSSWDTDIKPDDHNIIYALTRSGNNFALAVSNDGGQSFSLEPSFPSSINETSGGLLAVSPANPDMLWVIMLSSDNTPYLYQGNLDNGNWSWNLLATGQTSSFGMNNGQGYFDLVLDVSPINPDIILVGTTTLYKSLNGGNSFSAVGGYSGNFSIHPDIQDIKMLPTGNTWVSTDGGMNFTSDNFLLQSNYHVRINNLIGSDMWGFDQGWNEDIVVGGRYHNGNTAIADFYQPKALRMGGAESPTGWMVQGRSRHAAFNDLGNGWILPPTAESAPEGRFIFSKYPNMDEYGGRRGNLVTHPNYYGTFYLGEENGFWKSTDLGVSYDLLYTFPNRVRYLQISYSNPDVFYADVVNQGLYKSEDGGLSWTLKPALCSSPNGTSYWKGKLFFAISPYDENLVYACLQNGTWSSDIGKVFRSEDGGDSWEEWTGTLSEYTKCICVQPSDNQSDIVYLFTTSRGGSLAGVYYRTEEMGDWAAFDTDYPAGMSVNMAMPFFRDGKLRVAGSGGIWESTLKEPEFEPVINPWVERSHFNCMLDTLYFEDHSIMNHEGAEWTWNITPDPVYIEDTNMRNPRVVLGNPGSYSVTLNITKNGNIYSKTIPDMFTTSTCPSIEDCSNPADLPKDIWELVYVDSEETNYPGLAIMSFDDDPETIWHTRWSTGSDPYPHEIQVDLGDTYRIYSFTYLTRQDGVNGRIKDYELYVSEDQFNWGDAVSIGSFENTSAPQSIDFPEGIIGKYFRLLALSEVNGNAWASAAEFSMVGCTDLTYGIDPEYTRHEIRAFPVPSNSQVSISLPQHGPFNYKLMNINGQIIDKGNIGRSVKKYSFDLQAYPSGIYFIQLRDSGGTLFNVKVVKE